MFASLPTRNSREIPDVSLRAISNSAGMARIHAKGVACVIVEAGAVGCLSANVPTGGARWACHLRGTSPSWDVCALRP